MKEKLIQALIAKGLSEADANKLAALTIITDDMNVDEVATTLTGQATQNQYNSFEDVLANTEFKSHFDRLVTKATTTAIDNYKKKNEGGGQGGGEQGGASGSGGASPEMAKLTELITGLTESVTDLKNQKAIESKAATAKSLFEKSEVLKGVPNWFDRINPDDEANTVENQIKGLETEFKELQQGFINSAIEKGNYAPEGGGSGSEANASLIKEYATTKEVTGQGKINGLKTE